MAKKITVKQALDSLNEKYAKTLVMLDDALDVIEDLETQLEAKPKEVQVEVEKVVEVVKEVEVPKETVVTREVEVPGPERIVEVPGPERIVEKIVEVPVEKIVEKVVVKEIEVPRGPSEPEKLAEAMSLVHKGQMLPEEKSELEKLKEEFGHFRKLVNMQLSSLGGGGSTHILDMDDVDISSLGNGKFLKYNSTTGKLEFSDTVGTYTFS